MTLQSIKRSPGYARVRAILMRRDDSTPEDAECILDDCINELIECANNGDYESAAQCIEDHLGLEPDYLDDLIIPFI
jgi:DNA-binding GntR family transcriptional regulator